MTDPTRRLVRRLRALVQRDTLNRDVADEMRTHIDMEANDLSRTQGLPPDEARRRAAVAFGGVDRYIEDHHDARGVRWAAVQGMTVTPDGGTASGPASSLALSSMLSRQFVACGRADPGLSP